MADKTMTDEQILEGVEHKSFVATSDRTAASLSASGVAAEDVARAAAQAAYDKKGEDVQVLDLTEQIVAERSLTTLMVTHNMNDAIRLGNRLIMMHEGNVIFDVAGEEKKSLTVPDLLQKFEEVSGGELANDRMLLS